MKHATIPTKEPSQATLGLKQHQSNKGYRQHDLYNEQAGPKIQRHASFLSLQVEGLYYGIPYIVKLTGLHEWVELRPQALIDEQTQGQCGDRL